MFYWTRGYVPLDIFVTNHKCVFDKKVCAQELFTVNVLVAGLRQIQTMSEAGLRRWNVALTDDSELYHLHNVLYKWW